MNPRIDKLLRQRDLLREHLNWIEEEIAAAQPGKPTASAESSTAVTMSAVEKPEPETAPELDSSTDETIVPEPNVSGIHNEVRAGCLLYFGIAAATVGLLVAFIYWRY